jgi:superfamily I DNA/RNA helicase
MISIAILMILLILSKLKANKSLHMEFLFSALQISRKFGRDSLPGTSLFCAGDDWQAIYRFSSADATFPNMY